jgi:hypothetical protein
MGRLPRPSRTGPPAVSAVEPVLEGRPKVRSRDPRLSVDLRQAHGPHQRPVARFGRNRVLSGEPAPRLGPGKRAVRGRGRLPRLPGVQPFARARRPGRSGHQEWVEDAVEARRLVRRRSLRHEGTQRRPFGSVSARDLYRNGALRVLAVHQRRARRQGTAQKPPQGDGRVVRFSRRGCPRWGGAQGEGSHAPGRHPVQRQGPVPAVPVR